MNALLLALSLSTLAPVGEPLETHSAREQLAWSPSDLMGRHDKPLVEPEGYYQVVIPSGFDCAQRNTVLGKRRRARRGQRVLECTGMRGARARLTLAVKDVPRSATSTLVALNETEKIKDTQEHFKELERRALNMSGLDGVIIRYRYNRFGNLRHPIQVVALFGVAKGKLFEIRFESREDQLPRYQADLERVFESFQPARLDNGGRPIIAAPKVQKAPTGMSDEEFVERQLRKGNPGNTGRY